MHISRLDNMVIAERPGQTLALIAILAPIEERRIAGRWELHQRIVSDELTRDEALRLARASQIIAEKEVRV